MRSGVGGHGRTVGAVVVAGALGVGCASPPGAAGDASPAGAPRLLVLGGPTSSRFVPERLPGGFGPWACGGVADLDGDGVPELVAVGAASFRVFTRRSAAWDVVDVQADSAPHAESPIGCEMADLDGDGRDDLVAVGSGGGYVALNRGHLAFQVVPLAGGMPGAVGRVVYAAAALRVPGRPLPDLYLARNGVGTAMGFLADGCACTPDGLIRCGHQDRDYPGAPSGALRGAGGGALAPAPATGLEEDAESQAVAVYDLDGDGLQDVFVANDAGRNRLYRNRGDGTYADVARAAGVDVYNHGMSALVGDLDGDGQADLAVSEIGLPLVQLGRGSSFGPPLGRANGLGAVALWSWGAEMEDFDNDGDLDLVFFGNPMPDEEVQTLCPGHALDGMAEAELVLFRNDGTAHFTAERPAPNGGREFDENSGFFPGGHTLAGADVDGDGVLDLFALRAQDVDGIQQEPWLLRGQLARAAGGITVAAPQGARVTACVGARCQTREVGGAHGASAFHAREVHFGIGAAAAADVRVDLPGGQGRCQRTVRAAGRVACAAPGAQ